MPPVRCTRKHYPRAPWMNCAFYYNRRTTKDLPDSCGRRSLRAVVLLHAGVFQAAKKVSEPFVLTPFRRAAHRLYSTVAKCWRIAGCAAIPAEQAGKQKASCAFFFWRCRRAHLIHRLRCRWPAHILRSQQPRTPQLLRSALWNTRTRDSDLRHADSSRRFRAHGTAFGAGGLLTSASFPSRFSV